MRQPDNEEDILCFTTGSSLWPINIDTMSFMFSKGERQFWLTGYRAPDGSVDWEGAEMEYSENENEMTPMHCQAPDVPLILREEVSVFLSLAAMRGRSIH